MSKESSNKKRGRAPLPVSALKESVLKDKSKAAPKVSKPVRKSSSSSSSSQSRSASVSIKRDDTTSQRESDVKTAKHNVKSIKKQQKSSKPASPARKAPAGS